MAKKLNGYVFIDGKHCSTETNYKEHRIYKICSKGLEFYSILKGKKLEGTFWKLKDAKDEVDKQVIK